MLRQDVEHERDRADRAEQQVEVERQPGDEGRKRVDGLISELADTSTAAMIRGCEAAALRTLLELLTNPPALVAKVVPVTDLDPDLHAELERLGPANVREALRRTPLGCVRGV